jgi:hypothetical protein
MKNDLYPSFVLNYMNCAVYAVFHFKNRTLHWITRKLDLCYCAHISIHCIFLQANARKYSFRLADIDVKIVLMLSCVFGYYSWTRAPPSESNVRDTSHTVVSYSRPENFCSVFTPYIRNSSINEIYYRVHTAQYYFMFCILKLLQQHPYVNILSRVGGYAWLILWVLNLIDWIH